MILTVAEEVITTLRMPLVLALTVLFQTSSIAQTNSDAAAGLDGLFDPDSEQTQVMLKGAVALQCAAIAERVNGHRFKKEHARLLAVGIDTLSVVFGEAIESGREIPEPFETRGEWVAFALGSMYGGAAERLLAEFMDAPETEVHDFYRRRFDEENCFIVGV